MELLGTPELMKRYAKETSKFCMYISWQEDDNFLIDELLRAAPYLEGHEVAILTANKHLILTFDTEEEMDHHFDQTVGDDGPTELNNYIGPVRVYALTCSDKGKLWNENT